MDESLVALMHPLEQMKHKHAARANLVFMAIVLLVAMPLIAVPKFAKSVESESIRKGSTSNPSVPPGASATPGQHQDGSRAKPTVASPAVQSTPTAVDSYMKEVGRKLSALSEVTKAIVYSALGSLLAVVIQLGAARYTEHYRRRATRMFWQFKRNRITVVHPIFHDDTGNPISEQLARLEIVAALYALLVFLREQGYACQMQSDSSPPPADSDIILVSSPKGNRQSAALIERLAPPFEIKRHGTTFCYRDRSSSVEYDSPADRTGEKADIGLIARITDADTDRRLFLLWGIHIPGTLAAVRFVTKPDKLRSLAAEVGKGDVAFLVAAPFHYVSENIPDIGDIRLLTPAKHVLEGQHWA